MYENRLNDILSSNYSHFASIDNPSTDDLILKEEIYCVTGLRNIINSSSENS